MLRSSNQAGSSNTDTRVSSASSPAPWLTILLVGHIAMPMVLAVEENLDPAMWLGLSIYLPLVVLLTLALLPRCKGLLLALD